MRSIGFTATCLFALTSTSTAFDKVLRGPQGRLMTLEKRDSSCTNGPDTRSCWSDGFDADTDFDQKWPDTGKTVSYYLELTNGTCNPDGQGERPCQLFNNQLPGPVITADWGDTVSITVKNSLQDNGTGVHWHGIRQLNTNPMDGVGGVTECALAPGDTKTYTWKATQFGSAWYHSHFSSQYGDGAFGAIVLNGPASANYDVDLGPYVVNDWYYRTAWEIGINSQVALQSGAPGPPPDTILINGTNINANGGGSYNRVNNLQKGKKYRLRIINTSTDNAIRVSLDNHPFTVITGDLVPIKPFTTEWILLAVGQRYDVVITANQTSGNYWFRANAASACQSANSNPNAKAIFSYANTPGGNPSSSAFSEPNDCNEPSDAQLIPWVKNTVDSTAFMQQVKELDVDFSQEQTTTNGKQVVVWSMNMTGIQIKWDKPTMKYVKDGKANNIPKLYNVIDIPEEGMMTYWIIQEPANTKAPIPHPIHLHGHDFYILGRGSGIFDKNTSPNTLTFTNPTRRDTSLLPGGGWLALGFPADNPGAWMMHCHIAWHVAGGLGLQFLESKDTAPVGNADWDHTCSHWAAYQKGMPYPQFDSGLRMMERET